MNFFNVVNGRSNDKILATPEGNNDILEENFDEIDISDAEVVQNINGDRLELENHQELVEYEREQIIMIYDDSLVPMTQKSKIKQVLFTLKFLYLTCFIYLLLLLLLLLL